MPQRLASESFRFTSFLPSLFTLVAALMTLTPIPVASNTLFMPSFVMIAVFYWSLLTPAYLPLVIVFIIALLMDSFTGAPMGMYGLTLLLLRLFVMMASHRFVKQTIWFYWAGFVAMSLPAWVAFWLGYQFAYDAVLPLAPILLHWLWTAMWYPLVHMIFTRTLRMVRNPKR